MGRPERGERDLELVFCGEASRRLGIAGARAGASGVSPPIARGGKLSGQVDSIVRVRRTPTPRKSGADDLLRRADAPWSDPGRCSLGLPSRETPRRTVFLGLELAFSGFGVEGGARHVSAARGGRRPGAHPPLIGRRARSSSPRGGEATELRTLGRAVVSPGAFVAASERRGNTWWSISALAQIAASQRKPGRGSPGRGLAGRRRRSTAPRR